MAGASLLALIDDIAAILDDVAAMTKVAASKTAGVVGDDLALNAQQVAGVRAERELPVIWAVAVGSLKNKFILVPAALAISAVAPWAVLPLLMLGGLYLCLEGVEKLAAPWLHHDADTDRHAADAAALDNPSVDMVAWERDRIRGAIRTDFVLSAEIIVIALGSVADATFPVRVAVLCGIGLLMTVGVYGLVAMIVKLDDLGAYLLGCRPASARQIGRLLLIAAPRLMKTLTVVGTAAMFLVGGSIVSHGLPPLHEAIHRLATATGPLAGLAGMVLEAAAGVLAGALALAVVSAAARLRRR